MLVVHEGFDFKMISKAYVPDDQRMVIHLPSISLK